MKVKLSVSHWRHNNSCVTSLPTPVRTRRLASEYQEQNFRLNVKMRVPTTNATPQTGQDEHQTGFLANLPPKEER